ncbi:hypothetical protein CORC01_12084 [Colletotrichum orchidophilum]|uniref:Uncharacterized protein n=1 Tax=Colletotrichum orchidophilum TaxID=1209926 RepID=A0A1G4AU08_9PEZI|nr:hypothetical protein CORC01_12084 [Colletotrichum orchidophilum]
MIQPRPTMCLGQTQSSNSTVSRTTN